MAIFPPLPQTLYDTAMAATTPLIGQKALLELSEPKATLVRITNGSPAFGVAGISASYYPREVMIVNVGPEAFFLRHEDGSVEESSRLICPGDVSIAMALNDIRRLVYDTETQRWRVI